MKEITPVLLTWPALVSFFGAMLFSVCAAWAGIPLILVLGMVAGVMMIAYGFS